MANTIQFKGQRLAKAISAGKALRPLAPRPDAFWELEWAEMSFPIDVPVRPVGLASLSLEARSISPGEDIASSTAPFDT